MMAAGFFVVAVVAGGVVPLGGYLAERLEGRDGPLLMAHLVCGYPSLDDNWRALEVMASAGVEVVELQFPFSEPSADGPLLAAANHGALAAGVGPQQCFELMARASDAFPFALLMMGYYNSVYAMGEERFVERLAQAGGSGFIIADLPLEESARLRALADDAGLAQVLLMAPTCSDERLAHIGRAAQGLVYGVSRRGVTGARTAMGDEVAQFAARCRRATDAPLALGFGIQRREDVDFVGRHAQVAVVGSALMRAWQGGGADGMDRLLQEMRA